MYKNVMMMKKNMKNGESEEPRKGRRFCEKVDGKIGVGSDDQKLGSVLMIHGDRPSDTREKNNRGALAGSLFFLSAGLRPLGGCIKIL